MPLRDLLARLLGARRCVECDSTDAPYTHTLTDDHWCAACYPYARLREWSSSQDQMS